MITDNESFETLEQIKEQLETVEKELAMLLNIFPIEDTKYIRQILITLDKANELTEDEMVCKWQRLHSKYVAWIKTNE